MGSNGHDGLKTRLHGWNSPSPLRLFGSFLGGQKEQLTYKNGFQKQIYKQQSFYTEPIINHLVKLTTRCYG
jgi:hypothetical protein